MKDLELIKAIVERQKEWVNSNHTAGNDCTEQESAEIKMFVKEHLVIYNDEELRVIEEIQLYLPLEYGEAIEESELK